MTQTKVLCMTITLLTLLLIPAPVKGIERGIQINVSVRGPSYDWDGYTQILDGEGSIKYHVPLPHSWYATAIYDGDAELYINDTYISSNQSIPFSNSTVDSRGEWSVSANDNISEDDILIIEFWTP